jgi:hypothetical protein
VLGSLPLRLGPRLAFGAGVGAWIALAVAVTISGAMNASPLVLLAMFALPLAGAVLVATSSACGPVVAAIPVPLIVGLNVMRVLGVLFLFLAAAGRMGGPFPYFAGIGDIITGLFALPVARLAAQNPRDIRVMEWNIFGALDLVVAVSLGLLSVSGSPLQLIHAGAGSAAMVTLPWSLIPLVLVPAYLIGHALVFARLRASAGKNGANRARSAQIRRPAGARLAVPYNNR